VFLGTAAVLLLGGWLFGLAVLHAVTPGAPGSGWVDALTLAAVLGAGVRASRAGRSFLAATLVALAVAGPVDLFLRIGFSGPSPLSIVALASALLAALGGCAYAALGVLLATRLSPVLAASGTLAAALAGSSFAGLAARGETTARAVFALRCL